EEHIASTSAASARRVRICNTTCLSWPPSTSGSTAAARTYTRPQFRPGSACESADTWEPLRTAPLARSRPSALPRVRRSFLGKALRSLSGVAARGMCLAHHPRGGVDRINLMQQAKNAYWKVQKTTCTALHALFDEIVDAAEESLNLLAEWVMHLGGLAEGKLQGATQYSRVCRMAPHHPSWDRGLWHFSWW